MAILAGAPVLLLPDRFQPAGCHLRLSASWPWGKPGSSLKRADVQNYDLPAVVRPEVQISKQIVHNGVKMLPGLNTRFGESQEQSAAPREETWLPEAPIVENPRSVYNASVLAYMGDAIYELYVRRRFLSPPQKMEHYNDKVMALVCCEAQHTLLQQLLKKKILTEQEKDVLRWGKNVEAGHKRARRRAGSFVYNSASSLETLIGYLYLSDSGRLREVMGQLGF